MKMGLKVIFELLIDVFTLKIKFLLYLNFLKYQVVYVFSIELFSFFFLL